MKKKNTGGLLKPSKDIYFGETPSYCFHPVIKVTENIKPFPQLPTVEIILQAFPPRDWLYNIFQYVKFPERFVGASGTFEFILK